MKSQVKIFLILTITLIGALVYASVPGQGDEEPLIKKIGMKAWEAPKISIDSALVALDEFVKVEESKVDSTPQRILLFGDSMVEGLATPFASYAAANGDEYKSVCWYSSTSIHWAKTDTLKHFINEFKPTYILVCLGGNELFVRDVDKREENVKKILSVIGNIPYVWIGTPNWKKDTGIGEVHRRLVGMNRYYESDKLFERNKGILKRGKDGAHPTFASAAIWMDSVAVFIRSLQNKRPIVFDKYQEKVKPTQKHLVLLQPMTM